MRCATTSAAPLREGATLVRPGAKSLRPASRAPRNFRKPGNPSTPSKLGGTGFPPDAVASLGKSPAFSHWGRHRKLSKRPLASRLTAAYSSVLTPRLWKPAIRGSEIGISAASSLAFAIADEAARHSPTKSAMSLAAAPIPVAVRSSRMIRVRDGSVETSPLILNAKPVPSSVGRKA